jgi:bifunctional UDP-N-acetylglucosamine pyrophosphorylase/glucosamine-1-phosphate N-acetyltransferase
MWWRELQAQRDLWPAISGPDECLIVDPTAIISDGVLLDTSLGPIVIGARTKICRGAHLQGPISIGSDCLVGDLAIVRGPVRIGDGTRIGFATEIKNAIIAERVTIGPQCFVADSKVESEAYLGAQVRTSNHRLDKATVKVVVDGEAIDTGMDKLGCLIGAGSALGIQVIILPGRVVAPGSIFAPRITIEKNLPPGRYRPAQRLEAY